MDAPNISVLTKGIDFGARLHNVIAVGDGTVADIGFDKYGESATKEEDISLSSIQMVCTLHIFA